MKMKRIAVFMLVILTALSVYSVTWTWSSPYEDTYGFRYQLDTEIGENWTYVPSSVTSLTLDNVAPDTTLYVQLSRDGLSWSPSGIATYVPDEDEPEKAEISANITSAPDMLRPRVFEFSLTLDVGADMFYLESLNVAPYGGVALDFKNIYSPTSWFGLGLGLRTGASFVPENGNIITSFTEGRGFADLDKGLYADLSIAFSFIVAPSVELNVLAGGGISALNASVPTLFEISGKPCGAYTLAGLSLDRYFGRMFHMGLSYNFKYFFAKDGSGINMHSAGIHMGLTF